MGRAIGLLLAVVVIWITVELYTQGTSNAFGGRFSALIGGADAAQPPRAATAQRVGDAVERARREHEQRYGELMPE
jgi:hypothetical protein